MRKARVISGIPSDSRWVPLVPTASPSGSHGFMFVPPSSRGKSPRVPIGSHGNPSSIAPIDYNGGRGISCKFRRVLVWISRVPGESRLTILDLPVWQAKTNDDNYHEIPRNPVVSKAFRMRSHTVLAASLSGSRWIPRVPAGSPSDSHGFPLDFTAAVPIGSHGNM